MTSHHIISSHCLLRCVFFSFKFCEISPSLFSRVSDKPAILAVISVISHKSLLFSCQDIFFWLKVYINSFYLCCFLISFSIHQSVLTPLSFGIGGNWLLYQHYYWDYRCWSSALLAGSAPAKSFYKESVREKLVDQWPLCSPHGPFFSSEILVCFHRHHDYCVS